jgi:hypothetical protein
MPPSVVREWGQGPKQVPAKEVRPESEPGPQEERSFFYNDSKGGLYFAPARGDFFQSVLPVDTGSTIKNYGYNSWISARNLLGALGNLPLEILTELDERMRKSMFSQEWQAFQDMAPFMRVMGLAVETAGTLSYLRGMLPTSKQAAAVAQSMAFGASGVGVGGGLLPGKRLAVLPPDVPIIGRATEMQNAVRSIVDKFARDPKLIGEYIYPGEYNELSDAQAYARMGEWSDLERQAPTLFGKAVERAFQRATSGSGLLTHTGQLRGPGGRFISSPDFQGIGGFNGMFFEITTNNQWFEHTLRGYPSGTVYLTYDIPVTWYFFLTP